MAIGLAMTFDGVTKQQYEAVMAPEGLDLATPANASATDKWPDGIVSHVAGATATGWCVVDVWQSQADFDRFFTDRLGPNLARVGLPQPNVVAFEVYNSHTV
jgi:hypothetical protein